MLQFDKVLPFEHLLNFVMRERYLIKTKKMKKRKYKLCTENAIIVGLHSMAYQHTLIFNDI